MSLQSVNSLQSQSPAPSEKLREQSVQLHTKLTSYVLLWKDKLGLVSLPKLGMLLLHPYKKVLGKTFDSRLLSMKRILRTQDIAD